MLINSLNEKEDDKQKTVFEKVINELRNIEYCLKYFIRTSENKELMKPSLIKSSSFVLSDGSSVNRTVSLASPGSKIPLPM